MSLVHVVFDFILGGKLLVFFENLIVLAVFVGDLCLLPGNIVVLGLRLCGACLRLLVNFFFGLELSPYGFGRVEKLLVYMIIVLFVHLVDRMSVQGEVFLVLCQDAIRLVPRLPVALRVDLTN